MVEILVFGHRGWPERFPENTLSGLMAAAEVADGVEVDVRRSADGKLILSHDPELLGLSVAETSWAELAELDLGQGHHPALLDEAMAALPDTPMQLEVKNWPMDPGFEPDHRLALETAERARPGDIVTCFNPETLASVRRTFPEVATGLAVSTEIDAALEECERRGHQALIPHFNLIQDSLDTDLDVFPWTVNDVDIANELVQMGVTGIITDDPGPMAERLRRQT